MAGQAIENGLCAVRRERPRNGLSSFCIAVVSRWRVRAPFGTSMAMLASSQILLVARVGTALVHQDKSGKGDQLEVQRIYLSDCVSAVVVDWWFCVEGFGNL